MAISPTMILAGSQAVTGLISGLSQRSNAKTAAAAHRAAGDLALEASEASAILLEAIGVRAANDQRRLSLLLASSQRVAFARNGVNVGTGSALDVALDTAVEGELAAQNAKFGFESAAYRERVKGLIDAFNAESSARIVETTGLASGNQTILGGAVSALGTIAGAPQSAGPAASGTTVKVPITARVFRGTLPLRFTGAAST